MTSLVNLVLKFQMILCKNSTIFCLKNVRSFCCAKAPHNFSAENITAVDLVSTVGLDKSSTNDLEQQALFSCPASSHACSVLPQKLFYFSIASLLNGGLY